MSLIIASFTISCTISAGMPLPVRWLNWFGAGRPGSRCAAGGAFAAQDGGFHSTSWLRRLWEAFLPEAYVASSSRLVTLGISLTPL